MTTRAVSRALTGSDIHRQFNALFAMTVAYKPFHNPLSKATFSDLMREVLCGIVQHWVVEVLRPKAHGPLEEFGRILIQDGCSFAIDDALHERYPGRFHKQNPAAVELHVTMSLLDESVSAVTLTPDTAAERAYLPEPRTLCGDLLLADRGYFDRAYLDAVNRAGGHDVVRASASVNPMVRKAYTARGEELAQAHGRRLKECVLPTDEVVDLDVVWRQGAKTWEGRIVAHWNAHEERYTWLVMNLSRARVTGEQVGQVYRLRWQVELMFKEWKSYANLHAFDTSHASIAEGLIWTAIAASILKRYLGQMTQALRAVEVSTRKVAMCARHRLGEVFRVLATGHGRGLARALGGLVDYLACNARRSHPKRDRKTGRLQFGLEPHFGSS